MKLTAVLFKHNKYRMFRRHWFIQGKKILHETEAEKILKEHGIEVVPINEVIYPALPKEKIEVVGSYERPIPRDKNHPDYKQTPCFIYKDNDVLVEALNQAKALTNTVEITDSLPVGLKNIEENLAVPDEVHQEFKNKIMLACLFEATMDKLPRKIDPARPMYRFQREYGISETQRSNLLRLNLVSLMESYWLRNELSHIQHVEFSLPLNIFNKLIKFDLSSEISITSKKPLNVISNPEVTKDVDLPDIYPLDPTISLKPYHFYDVEDSYPVDMDAKWPYIHTSFVDYNTETVQNLHGTPVKEDQIISRGLLKGFCIAGSQARAKFGNEVEELPEPIVTQVVQTNGQWFHFSVFQLNTLTLDKHSPVKNIFWSHPRLWLYNSCSYVDGKPTMVNYNPEVLNKCVSFYRNE